jgi:hypothetical protein
LLRIRGFVACSSFAGFPQRPLPAILANIIVEPKRCLVHAFCYAAATTMTSTLPVCFPPMIAYESR